MTHLNIWAALAVACGATFLTRLSGAWLAASPLLEKINQETLSRLFPLVILFCLVLKEIASSFNGLQISHGIVAITSVGIVVILHLWRRSLFISIIGGTALHGVFLALERHLSR